MDAGLLFVIGRVADGITLEEAETGVWKELETLQTQSIPDEEFEKVRNRAEAERTFNNINYLNRAINMAQMELVGQDRELNEELQRYCTVTAEDIMRVAKEIFVKKNCSVLYYKRKP
jgi:predicted Zn-dependent peptidase